MSILDIYNPTLFSLYIAKIFSSDNFSFFRVCEFVKLTASTLSKYISVFVNCSILPKKSFVKFFSSSIATQEEKKSYKNFLNMLNTIKPSRELKVLKK